MISEGKDRARRDHYGVSRECRRRNYRYILDKEDMERDIVAKN
jgi:hypothetical protein